jgi:hypothetical protein
MKLSTVSAKVIPAILRYPRYGHIWLSPTTLQFGHAGLTSSTALSTAVGNGSHPANAIADELFIKVLVEHGYVATE